MFCRLSGIVGTVAASVWSSTNAIQAWPCDLSGSPQLVELFDFVPVELRRQVKLIC